MINKHFFGTSTKLQYYVNRKPTEYQLIANIKGKLFLSQCHIKQNSMLPMPHQIEFNLPSTEKIENQQEITNS